jgi:hypothetical protein
MPTRSVDPAVANVKLDLWILYLRRKSSFLLVTAKDPDLAKLFA